MFNSSFDQQAVYNNLNGMVLSLIELQIIFETYHFAINACASEAVLNQLLYLLFRFSFAPTNDRREDHDSVFRSQRHHSLRDLFGRLEGNGMTALRAMWSSDRGE